MSRSNPLLRAPKQTPGKKQESKTVVAAALSAKKKSFSKSKKPH
jgi:hypothetical protein